MQVSCHSLDHSSFTIAYIHNIPISTISIPVASVKFSQFSSRGFGNRRYRNLAKSASPDAETSQSSTQFPGKNGATSSSPSFLSLLCPLLKLFSGGDPSQQRNFTLEVTTSALASLARFAWGSKSVVDGSQNKEITSDLPMRLQLFEFEACPFCRRVREAMTELDLSVEVYPCPKGSVRHREEVRRSGGKEQFPFLIDPNSGISMYESGDIVKYLFERYGEGRIPSTGLLESTLFTGWMPTILRAGRGMTLWECSRADPPAELLELFSYENNLYARIVREALCELELPYILHNAGEGSHRRKLLFAASGSKEVPYIIDPNTGFRSGNYKMILSYLFQTYSAATGGEKEIQEEDLRIKNKAHLSQEEPRKKTQKDQVEVQKKTNPSQISSMEHGLAVT